MDLFNITEKTPVLVCFLERTPPLRFQLSPIMKKAIQGIHSIIKRYSIVYNMYMYFFVIINVIICFTNSRDLTRP